MKKIALSILLVTSITWATPGFVDHATTPAPTDLLNVALIEVSQKTKVATSEILEKFSIEWTWIAIYNDDQPIEFLFQSPEHSCRVQVGSQTLTLWASTCSSPARSADTHFTNTN